MVELVMANCEGNMNAIFPNNSVGVSRMGYMLMILGGLFVVIDLVASPNYPPGNLMGNVAVVAAGYVAISVAKRLKTLEDRLASARRD